MAARQQHKTTYKGVFFINGKDPATGNTDRIYYIRYYKSRKFVEERAGRQLRDRMTPAKAHRLRVLRIEGRLDPNEERREKVRAERNKMTIARIWEAFMTPSRKTRVYGTTATGGENTF